jgi:hypothetical protein
MFTATRRNVTDVAASIRRASSSAPCRVKQASVCCVRYRAIVAPSGKQRMEQGK